MANLDTPHDLQRVSGPGTGYTSIPKKILRGLETRYLAAISLVIILLLSSWYIKDSRTAQTLEDARIINDAGRQRMLSQRFLYLTHKEQVSDEATLSELKSILDLFESSQDELSAIGATIPEVRPAYEDSTARQSLNTTAARFIETGRRAIDAPGNPNIKQDLRELAEETLLAQLDYAVKAFEKASHASIQNLMFLERASFILAIATIFLEALFVFIPGHRSLKSLVTKLERQNLQLVRAGENLRDGREALQRKSDDLEAAADRLFQSLEESEALRKEQIAFTYAVSHDLKSPANTVAMVLTEIEVSKSDALDEDMRELLAIASGAIGRMSVLVDAVLNYGQVANSEMKHEQINLNALVAEVQADLGGEIKQTQAVISVENLDDAWGHSLQTRMLIQNLLSNAIKFCPSDRIPEVSITSSKDSKRGIWTLRVRDNGISIPPADRKSILGLFKRLHTRKTYDGSGIGLALCDRIARNHGGKVWFEDHVGPGITAVVEFRNQKRPDTAARLEENTGYAA